MKDAMEMENKEFWRLDMDEEIDSLRNNDTWDLLPFSDGRKLIGCIWVLKKKICLYGNVENMKARLVAKGYSYVEGIDLGKIFMDEKTAFLCGDLEEEVYVTQLEQYIKKCNR
jgi:hypothetical protein